MSDLYTEIVSKGLNVDPSIRNDGYIADQLSIGRVKLVTTKIGISDVLRVLGPDAGTTFLDSLESAATTNPLIKWTLVLLNNNDLDISLSITRDKLDAFVGTLLTSEQAALLKSLAEVPDNITVEQVTKAFEGR